MFFNKPVKDIISFKFRYTYNNSKDGFVEYIILKGDNEHGASVKLRNESAEERREFPVRSEDVLRLEEILNRYKVGKWDGFHKSNKYVLDGNSCSMYVKTKDGTHIEANGYMRYPAKYKEVRQELDGLFEDLYRGYKA